jgi:hypothetical protein
MAYTINKTDGSLLTEIIDSAIDTTATDLSLIGKNVTGYGELINENFVKLLENFASTSEPNNPIAGQLWFDQTDNRLKVYDGNGFAIASGPIVSGTAPLTPNQGDFWIDNKEKQLYFYDGARSRFLAGKIWSDGQGKSGFEVNTTSDSFGNRKTITYLWNAGNLLGIFSNHAAFDPIPAIAGIITIKPGFTVSTNATNFKINAPAESADFLKSVDGEMIPAEDFLIFNQPNNLTETLTISNTEPLILGEGAEASILVGSGLTEIRNQIGQNFKISTLDDLSPIFYAEVSSKRIGIFNNDPQAALDVTGDVIVGGNLTVNGTTTTINSTNISVDDKNIELCVVATFNNIAGTITSTTTTTTVTGISSTVGMIPGMGLTKISGTGTFGGETVIVSVDSLTQLTVLSTTLNTAGSLIFNVRSSDTLANGGGITVRGATDKTLNWANASDSWTSSENFDLAVEKSYKINGANILSETTLGSSVVNSNLQSVGTLNVLTVDNIRIDDGVITSLAGTLTISSATSIIDVSNKRITNLADPVGLTDAVNKRYLDDKVPSPWRFSNDFLQFAEDGDRFLVNTISSPSVISLPANPQPGDTVRFIDYNGSFGLNPLTIVRAREPVFLDSLSPPESSGDNIGAVLGTYFNVATTAVSGTGTGLILEITTTVNASYSLSNTTISVVNPGVGYKDEDRIKVLGSALGGTDVVNDLILELDLKNILVIDEDYLVDSPNSAFSLVYTSQSQGWQFTDSVSLPPMIFADLTGNVTGNVSGNLTGDVSGNVNGNVNGNVTGNLTGNVLGDLDGDVTGNVLGNLTGNVLGNVTGDLEGNITNCSTITAQNDLTIETVADNIKLISGSDGIRLSAYDDTGTQEQYAIQVNPGTASGNRSTTLLFGNVVIANQTGGNINGASFKLPSYTNAERDALTMSFLNYGEIIHNTDLTKIQAYLAPGAWVNLN